MSKKLSTWDCHSSSKFYTRGYQQSRSDSTANRIKAAKVSREPNGVYIELYNTVDKVVDTMVMSEAEFTRFCLNLTSQISEGK